MIQNYAHDFFYLAGEFAIFAIINYALERLTRKQHVKDFGSVDQWQQALWQGFASASCICSSLAIFLLITGGGK